MNEAETRAELIDARASCRAISSSHSRPARLGVAVTAALKTGPRKALSFFCISWPVFSALEIRFFLH
jgi:hypothetical protein